MRMSIFQSFSKLKGDERRQAMNASLAPYFETQFPPSVTHFRLGKERRAVWKWQRERQKIYTLMHYYYYYVLFLLTHFFLLGWTAPERQKRWFMLVIGCMGWAAVSFKVQTRLETKDPKRKIIFDRFSSSERRSNYKNSILHCELTLFGLSVVLSCPDLTILIRMIW